MRRLSWTMGVAFGICACAKGESMAENQGPGNSTDQGSDQDSDSGSGSESASQGFVAHYFTAWSAPYIHFDDGGGWTAVPGQSMKAEGESWFVYAHDSWSGYVAFAFNDGAEAWDSNGEQNYTSSWREFWVRDGVVLPEKPSGGDADTDADTDADSDSDTDTDSDADTESDTELGTEPETDQETEAATDSETQPDSSSESGADADVDADVDADTDSDVDVDADSDTDADTDTSTDADTDSATDTLGKIYEGTGVRKTIVIDGQNTLSEWGDDTLLVRDPAADDARFLGKYWSGHEPPWDYAALHGAWDDSSLYIGIQYVNITDEVDPANLGRSEGTQIQNMSLIQFVVFDTRAGEGYSAGGDMWGKDHEFVGANRPDYQFYFHSNFSQEGTYWGVWQGSVLEQRTDGSLNLSLTGKSFEGYVGSTLMGVDPHADDSNPGQYGAANRDYLKLDHSKGLDTFFELKIPLKLLSLTGADLDSSAIGVFAANGDGSAVDSIPNDPATSSTVGVSNTNSPLEWEFAKDDDKYSVPFAALGTMPH